MGFDLKGKYTRVSYNWSGYRELFNTAISNGWEPAGTVFDEDPNWDGEYFSSDGQWVTDEDARGIARAIYASLRDELDELLDPDCDHAKFMDKWIYLEFMLFCRISGYTTY